MDEVMGGYFNSVPASSDSAMINYATILETEERFCRAILLALRMTDSSIRNVSFDCMTYTSQTLYVMSITFCTHAPPGDHRI